jgi:hypothetical protein
MTQIFHAVSILPDPPFFPFVLKKGTDKVSLSDASRRPAPPTLVAPLPLVEPLCCTPLVPLVHSGWLLRHLSSCHRLPSACASASHCTATSHHAPLTPLVRLVVASPLVTLPPPVCLRLRLSLHRRLSRRLLSGWLLHHLSSRRRLLSACASASHCTPLAPLVWLVVASPLVMPPLPPVRLCLCLSLYHCFSSRPSCASCQAGCCVTSCHAAASRPPEPPPLIAPPPLVAPPLAPLVRLVVASSLISCHAATSRPPAHPPLMAPPPLIATLLHLLSSWLSQHLSSCRRLSSA